MNKTYLCSIIGAGFFSLLLTVCNSGANTSPAQMIGVQKEKLSIQQAAIGTVGMLGEPADTKSLSTLQKGFSPLNRDVVKVSIGSQEQNFKSYVVGDQSTNAANFFTSVKVSGGFGLFSASLSTDYANKVSKQTNGITLVSQGYLNFPVNISIYDENYLTDSAKQTIKEGGGALSRKNMEMVMFHKLH